MAHPGTMHKYSKKLVAFEHASPHSNPSSSTSSSSPQNTLLWIGGLGDGLLTVSYPSTIASNLPPTWTLAEVLLRSSYNGWATGRLSRDAREISECVGYFRSLRPGGKIVLMGHSTGCQDIMEYLVGPDASHHPIVDGVVMQGGVSDREAWGDMLSSPAEKQAFEDIVSQAKEMIDQGEEKNIMQMKGNIVAEGLGAPMSAYRTFSLLSPGGDDDYFSSDLEDQRLRNTFGRIPAHTKVAFLLGDEDPYVPQHVDKMALLERWAGFIREGGAEVDVVNGGIVKGAHHNLNGDPESVVADLVGRVVGFVKGLGDEGGNGARL